MSGHGKRGRGGHAGGGGHGGWLVTYADLLTLLMVVFLVLWVISQVDLAKFEKFKQGLGDFGNPAPEQANINASNAAAAAATTTAAPGAGLGANGESLMTPTGELTSAGLDALAATMQEAVTLAGLPDIVSVTQTDRGLVISVSTDDLLFEPGSAEVLPAGIDVLGALAPALGGFNNKILVEGHTDRRPLKRAGYDNWDLSVDRAVTVVKIFRDLFAVDPLRLSAAGYGEVRPLVEGDDEASYATNRRVEIVVLAAIDAATAESAADAATTDETSTETTVAEAPATETTVPEPSATEPSATEPAASDPAAGDPLVPAGG